MRLRATMTVEVEYEVDTAHYGTDDPQQIVQMEQMSFDQDPVELLGRDNAQHWVDVEDITNATTPICQCAHPKFNIKGCQTGREPGVPSRGQMYEILKARSLQIQSDAE